jgi:hypothetical protein
MIEAIAIVGDLLRPNAKGCPGGVDRATQWLFDALKRPVHLACGLPIEVITATGNARLFELLRAARSPAESALYWAARYQALPDDDALLPVIRDLLQGRFCIGAELPPYLIQLLDRAEIPWIDIRVHPIRFLDDLLFAVRACTQETQTLLIGQSMQETEVFTVAGLVEAMCRQISEARMPPNTLLVVGQRPMDSSQIVGGQFFDAFAHVSLIASICAAYQSVVLKPHPLPDELHSLLSVSAAQPNVAGVITDNTYRMVAMPQVAAVLTVNSSVAYEACYFGKKVHSLAPLPVRFGWFGDPPRPDVYASIRDSVLTADFWRSVLAPFVTVTPADGMRLPPKPNRLRIARDAFWNYQEIDTDRIPSKPVSVWAQPAPSARAWG